MRVFLSWSGARSKAMAEVMRSWLPSVLQAVRPYFSPDDISKGSRWATEIAKELEASRVALLFITPENSDAPWLVFEAGALSRNLDNSKVCPLLFGAIESIDIKGPLVQFQAAKFSKEEVRRVLKMVNTELADNSLTSDVLDTVFEMWWPRLEQQISEKLQEGTGVKERLRRSERDLLVEILALARRNFRSPMMPLHSSLAFEDLSLQVLELCRLVQESSPTPEIVMALHRTLERLNYMSRRRLTSRVKADRVGLLESLRAERSTQPDATEIDSAEKRWLEENRP